MSVSNAQSRAEIGRRVLDSVPDRDALDFVPGRDVDPFLDSVLDLDVDYVLDRDLALDF